MNAGANSSGANLSGTNLKNGFRTSKRRHKHGASARSLSIQADQPLRRIPNGRRRFVHNAIEHHVESAMLDEAFRSAVQPELDLLGEQYSAEQIESTGVFG